MTQSLRNSGLVPVTIKELELSSEDEEVELSGDIKVIREVTGDTAYSNYELARQMPEETVKSRTFVSTFLRQSLRVIPPSWRISNGFLKDLIFFS